MMTIYDKEAMLGKLKDECVTMTAYVESAVSRA